MAVHQHESAVSYRTMKMSELACDGREPSGPAASQAPQRCRPQPTVVRTVVLAVGIALFSMTTRAQQVDQPAPSDHDHAKMNERGEQGMGFSQSATTHHFLLKPNGGVIQAEANDPDDTASRDNIRMHMRHIAHAFSSGDFDIPMFVHDTTPPGVPEMKRLAGKIHYGFQETDGGGRVVIATSDPEAKAAIHKFLRFQIEEHRTHDSTKAP